MGEPEHRNLNILYVLISGAGTARRMPELIEQFVPHFEKIIVVPTENAGRVISQRELGLIAGVDVVDSYFDDAIVPFPPFGVVLIAPCTFNSINKLAAGIADTLALSIAAEAIGRGTPVIVALSVNPPLFDHPKTQASAQLLESWGVRVMQPERRGDWLTLASDSDILAAVLKAREDFRQVD